MTKEDIKRTIEKYAFTPNDKEISAIYEILEGTKLIEDQKYDIVNIYGRDALLGILNQAVELANVDDAPIKEEILSIEQLNGPTPSRCPKCNKSGKNIVEIPKAESINIGYKWECLECENIFN